MTAPPAPGSVEIRPLRTQAELAECVRVQREVWGEGFSETVPPSILRVCQRIGGVAAGAFDPGGRMLGFVFGLTGVREGRLVHWSDMLAVRPEARDLGLGRRLKEHQRDALLPLEVEAILWTFDPLAARNAHLNFHRLGVEVEEYVPDMYGDSDSDLHRGLGTDRLVVAWRISGAPRPPAPTPSPRDELVPVPADIQRVKREAPEEAVRWRRETRARFVELLGRGYRVADFVRDPGSGGAYRLTPPPR